MAEAVAGAQRIQAASQGRLARVRRWFGRAGSDGHERHTLALIGKSTLAAAVSWVIARDVMAAQSPAFAPFSAVLIMQVTVYQSLVQALRYVGAVAVGVGLQGVLGLLAGPHLLTFVLVTLAALAIGRWRPLGSQGSQVATAAFFAFSTYVSATSDAQRWSQLGQIIVLVLIGCGIGVVVNTLVLPPCATAVPSTASTPSPIRCAIWSVTCTRRCAKGSWKKNAPGTGAGGPPTWPRSCSRPSPRSTPPGRAPSTTPDACGAVTATARPSTDTRPSSTPWNGSPTRLPP